MDDNLQNASDEDVNIVVRPVKFANYDEFQSAVGESMKNLDLLLDVKLQLRVKLGRANLPVKNILELNKGSLLELDKVAGEPVELFVNDQMIAHGEVMVIEDNFGLRITSIVDPEERLNEL